MGNQKQGDRSSLTRREFLRLASVAGAGVVAAACAPAPPTAAPEATEAVEDVPELLKAQGTLLEATILAVEAEIAGLRRELASYEAQAKYFTLQVDQALRVQAANEKADKLWPATIKERRLEEAN